MKKTPDGKDTNVPSKTPEEIKKALAPCKNKACEWCEMEYSCEVEEDALAYIEQLEARIPKWISVEERLPPNFVSVIAHMTDAGEFPPVQEAYSICGGRIFFFPVLREHHLVDYWMEMPEFPKEE